MLQLREFTLLPVADYVLGIKVYKRSGAKRPFAAIALLWRRIAETAAVDIYLIDTLLYCLHAFILQHEYFFLSDGFEQYFIKKD